jgi:branched-chain amino acid transport system substrate-binding protein
MVIAFALIATACGGDDGDEADDAAGGDITTTTLAEPTGVPIVIFSSRNIEGGQSSFGPQSYGFIAGLQAQNKRGGIQGRPIQADFCDGHSNANDEKACMQQGFDTGTVVAANTIYRPPTGEEAGRKFNEMGMLQLNNILLPIALPAEGAPDYVAGFPGTPSIEASYIMYKEKGLKRVLSFTNARIGAGIEPSEQELARRQKAGVTVLDPVSVDVTVADMAPTAQAAKETGADLITLGSLGQANDIKLLQAMEAIDYRPKISGPLQFTVQDLALVAPILEGRYFSATGSLPPDYTQHEEVKRFNEELLAGQRAGLPWLDQPYTSNHLQGWLTAQGIIAVLKEVKGDITVQSVTAAAKAAKNLEMGGIVAPWTPFLDEDPDVAGKQTYNSFYINTVKDGKVALVDTKLRCGRLDGCSK